MAEAGIGHGQHILALQGAAGMDGEHAGVVADPADVVDVVRQTLQFAMTPRSSTARGGGVQPSAASTARAKAQA
jgi:hypothetical protein